MYKYFKIKTQISSTESHMFHPYAYIYMLNIAKLKYYTIGVFTKYLRSSLLCVIIFNLNSFNLSLFRYNHKHEQLYGAHTHICMYVNATAVCCSLQTTYMTHI